MRINNSKILIIKLSYIGDTVTLIPVINNLKEKVPDATLDVMVNRGTEELLTYHPYIRNIYAYDRQLAKGRFFNSISYHLKLFRILRSEQYDVVIDFTLGDRSAFISLITGASTRISYQCATKISHLLMNHFIAINPLEHHIVDFQLEALRFFGLQDFRRPYEIYIPDQIQVRIDHLLDQAGVSGRPLNIAIHPGAGKKARQWRPERFGEIAQRLRAKYNARIILLGGPEDQNIVDVVEDRLVSDAALKFSDLSLLEMAALLKRCHLFIGNDTAPGHIAAGVQCPTLTLFGPNLPLLWRPISPHGDVLFKDLPCCRCRHEVELCIRPENNCMDMITVDEVWEKAEDLLAKVYFSPKMSNKAPCQTPE
jgi:predicted lipopolysaccharide heptosyltransferase III